MREPLPLATIHDAVLEFLRGRKDVVVGGATAVNAYASEPRMTQDIDLVSTHADELAQELRAYLSERFYIDLLVRVIGARRGYRLFQIRKDGNRHLIDMRPINSWPESRVIEEIQVLTPTQLIAQKALSYHSRRGQPKGFTDMRDLAVLFLTFPEMKAESGAVSDALKALDATADELTSWSDLVVQELRAPNDDDEFN